MHSISHLSQCMSFSFPNSNEYWLIKLIEHLATEKLINNVIISVHSEYLTFFSTLLDVSSAQTNNKYHLYRIFDMVFERYSVLEENNHIVVNVRQPACGSKVAAGILM